MPIRKYYRTTIEDKHKRKKDKKHRSWPKIVGGVFIFLLLVGIGVFAYFASKTPNIEDLNERIIGESTKIYDRTGSYLLYEAGEKKKTSVSLDQISPLLQKATLAAEDDDFYSHPGIDFKAIVRAIIYDVLHLGKSTQGGSTITQQLIKNVVFLETETNEEGKTEIVGPAPKTITRKIQEAIMALETERKYSKDQILEAYLNQISYGSVFYGAEAASQGYFQKSASELTLAEAATLAAMTQSPTYYLKNPKDREERKNWVLDRMVELKFTTKEEAEEAKKQKITLNPISQPRKAPYFTSEVEKQLEEMYGEYDQMGLRVFTTIDLDLQSLAENTVSDWAPTVENRYGAGNVALVSINPNNGEILAMVGGKNFEESQVNIWEYGFQSPGSAFKPIVYATAFKKGYTPDTILWDVKTVFDEKKPDWPDNYDLKQRGPIKMKEALAQSLNIPAVKTLYLAGINETINTAKSMGMIDTFDSELDKNSPNLSMAIGGKDVMPLELVSAYGVFATEGIRYLPNYILRIENARGEIIYEPESHPIQALDSEVCRQINSILSDDSLRAPMFGSRSKLYLNSWTAVKTGTASTEKGKITDAWTIGYTKDLVTGVWVGNNKNEPMRGKADGSYVAAPIWNAFMKSAEANTTPKAFTSPKQIKTGKAVLDGSLPKTTVKIDKISGKIATDQTPPDLIEEKSYYEAHSILWWVKKDDPRGEYPKNPYDDPATKNWEAGVQTWVKSKDGEFQLPTEKDDLHTEKNIPNIEITSQKITPAKDSNNNTIPLEERKIDFTIKINAPLGVKKIEVLLDGKSISIIDTNATTQSFSYNIKTLGEKEKYNFKIIVTDTAENKGETSVEISNL